MALVHAFGDECQLCHQNYPYYVYDFHHINPSKKSFGISRGTKNNQDELIQEAHKCVMLCANCHMIVEYSNNDYSFDDVFDENVYYQYIEKYGVPSRRKRRK